MAELTEGLTLMKSRMSLMLKALGQRLRYKDIKKKVTSRILVGTSCIQ